MPGTGRPSVPTSESQTASTRPMALDSGHGVREQQWDAKVVKALHDVSLEAARVGHELRHAGHVRPLEGHATGHDEADVTGAQDDDLASGEKPSMLTSLCAQPAV